MDDWSLTVHDAITGARVGRVESVESSWSTSIGGDGSCREKIVVNDADAPYGVGQLASLLRPNARLLVRWWGDFVVCAHKIEDWDYDKDAGAVTVQGVDLIAEADWRLIDGVGGAAIGSVFEFTGRSASGAVRATLARMMQHGGGWVYPIDLPDDGAGDVSGRFEFWEKYRISDILKQITDQTGVELFLRPYGTPSGGVRFQAVVAPSITFASSIIHLDASDTPLSGVHYRVDGKSQVTGLLGLGNGSGHDQELAWDAGVELIPIRDTKRSFPDLTGDALQRAVSAYYHANTEPLTQWSVGSYTISDGWGPAHAAPGSGWQLQSHGDIVIPDGEHPVRVIKTSGGNGRELNVEVQDAAA